MDRATALRFIETLTNSAVDPNANFRFRDICRKLKILHHPDHEGGSHNTFVAIGQAEEVLCAG